MSAREPASVSARGQVLVIDDDADHRSMMTFALAEHGFDVVEAVNGREGIDYLLHNPEPSIILLDLIMPEVSGWEVLTVLRTYLRLRRIPVIVVTGEPAAVQVPGVDVVARLQKPVQMNQLLALLSTHIKRKLAGTTK